MLPLRDFCCLHLSLPQTCIEDKKNVAEETSEEHVQVPVIDTTDQHRAHLFDLNCKVCTGKIVPGPEEQAATKKVHLQSICNENWKGEMRQL